MPREAVERQRLLLIEYYKTHDAPAKGKKHSEARKAEISAQRTQYWASLTPEQRAELGEKQGAPNRGKKRTNEQKARYALARTKYMSENPDTFGGPTAGELEIEAWLQKNRINYVRQFYIIGFPHPYDFFLPDHQTIVEFDGNHHWRDPWFAPRETTLVERWRMILKSMEKDAIESYFAGLNGYRIIRVRGINRCGDSPEYGSLEHQLELQGFKMPPA
jgi:very-short-patch-repair endonuclease